MTFPDWLWNLKARLGHHLANHSQRQKRHRQRSARLYVERLVLEQLEDRTVPSTFVTVDLSQYANTRIQNYQPSSAGYPEGMVTLGGIPFNIQAVGGNNAWNAEVVSGPYPHVLSVP